jgi:kynurenine formamidase
LDEATFPPPLKPLFRIISPEIEYIDHKAGAEIMCQLFNCPATDLPEQEGWAEDNISISSHLGTHVDAPWHYGSTTAGAKAKTIDEIPLEDLYCDGVVLDVSAKRGSGQAITVEDLQCALDKISYQIKAGDAVLMRTDHDKFAVTDPMRYHYPGMTRESTAWLAAQGAKVGGTDATGWDRPFHVMIGDYARTKDKAFIWDAHFACRDFEFYVIQQLCNLDTLPPHGFKVSFFPILLVGVSAAPARVVAFVDE